MTMHQRRRYSRVLFTLAGIGLALLFIIRPQKSVQAEQGVTTVLSARTGPGNSATFIVRHGNANTRIWFQSSGTYTASSTVLPQVSLDGETTWTALVSPSLTNGDMVSTPWCEPCSYMVGIPTHEGGGKTVTVTVGVTDGEISWNSGFVTATPTATATPTHTPTVTPTPTPV